MSKTSLFTSAIAFGALTSFQIKTSYSMEAEHNQYKRFNFNPIVEKYTDKKQTTKTTNLEPFFAFALKKEGEFYQEVSSAFLEIKNGNFTNFDTVYGGNGCQVSAVFIHDVGGAFEEFAEIPQPIQKVLVSMYLTSEQNTFDERGAFLRGRHENYERYKGIQFKEKKGNIEGRFKTIKKFLGECITHYQISSDATKSFLNHKGILRTTTESGMRYFMRYANINSIPIYLKIITNQKPVILMFENKDNIFKGRLLTKEPKIFGFVIRAHAAKEFNAKEIENNFENLLLEEAQNDDNEKVYGLEKKESHFFEIRHITGTTNPFEGV